MSNPSLDDIEKAAEKTESFVYWIARILHSKNWVKKLLLFDVLIFLFLNNASLSVILGIFEKKDLLDKIQHYTTFWVLLVAIIFIAAVIVAIKTIPHETESAFADLAERSPIKGLRPFEYEDAEIFAKLQRNEFLKECLRAITYSNFRFGILTGESGSGKTSLLQAGQDNEY